MQELRQMEFYILRASIATVQVGWERGGSALNQVLAYMAVPSFAGGGQCNSAIGRSGKQSIGILHLMNYVQDFNPVCYPGRKHLVKLNDSQVEREIIL
jgi:hypothetical protein